MRADSERAMTWIDGAPMEESGSVFDYEILRAFPCHLVNLPVSCTYRIDRVGIVLLSRVVYSGPVPVLVDSLSAGNIGPKIRDE